jgi:stress response protein SCP2
VKQCKDIISRYQSDVYQFIFDSKQKTREHILAFQKQLQHQSHQFKHRNHDSENSGAISEKQEQPSEDAIGIV